MAGGLGGPSRDVFCRPGVMGDNAIFPLRMGGLAALRKMDGSIAWQTKPDKQLSIKSIYSYNKQLLAAARDDRGVLEAKNGFLVRIDPASGAIEKLWESSGYTLPTPSFQVQLFSYACLPRVWSLWTRRMDIK